MKRNLLVSRELFWSFLGFFFVCFPFIALPSEKLNLLGEWDEKKQQSFHRRDIVWLYTNVLQTHSF